MFSVVIPLYNKELSIGRTIESVLAQTFTDFELIIVNDESSDSSVKIVESYNDPRILLLHQKNQGVSSARNRGINNARYDWIAFIDGDDLWNRLHLATIFRMINTYPEYKVFATSYEYSDGRAIYRQTNSSPFYLITDYFKSALVENVMWTGIVTIHKSCFEKSGLFNEELNRGEDLDLWARVALHYFIVKSQAITGIYKVESENKLTSYKPTLKICLSQSFL